MFSTDNLQHPDGGQLYTTDGYGVERLRTRSSECFRKFPRACISMEDEYITDFVQLSPQEVIFVALTRPARGIYNTCIRLLKRRTMRTSPYFSDIPCPPMHRRNLINVRVPSHHTIIRDQRDPRFVFTTVGKNDSYSGTLRVYDLAYRFRNQKSLRDAAPVEYNDSYDSTNGPVSRDFPMILDRPEESKYRLRSASTFSQDGPHLYSIINRTIYRCKLPPTKAFYSAQLNILVFYWLSGQETKLSNFLSGSFETVWYNFPNALIRINSTAYVLAESKGDRLRIMDLQTNTSSPLCITGTYDRIMRQEASTCALVEPWSLLKSNGSLYIGSYQTISRIFWKDPPSGDYIYDPKYYRQYQISAKTSERS